MSEKNHFWPLTRRDLFKLLPPSLAGFLPVSDLVAEPPEVAVGVKASPKATPQAEAKKWLADWTACPSLKVEFDREDLCATGG
jgi:hypothetical protein